MADLEATVITQSVIEKKLYMQQDQDLSDQDADGKAGLWKARMLNELHSKMKVKGVKEDEKTRYRTLLHSGLLGGMHVSPVELLRLRLSPTSAPSPKRSLCHRA